MNGSWWRGRRFAWDPDQQVIEQERQRWVHEQAGKMNELITELTIDPVRAYAEHREAWEQTGDLTQLRLMLEYVTCQ